MKTVLKTRKTKLALIISIFILLILAFITWLLLNESVTQANSSKNSYGWYWGTELRVVFDIEAPSDIYYVRHPEFFTPSHPYLDEHAITFGWSEEAILILNDTAYGYAVKIATEYKNFAVLDFEVDSIENETITIKFFGFGYPDNGKGESVPLAEEFVFDIINKFPVLKN
ncbi:MAG: hypothetical protein FWG70_01900 [Oscillospiraceae bacterium]|nr:hypothetical protein [Oscillospiraceae bacterium]